jgi:hypothetical protein
MSNVTPFSHLTDEELEQHVYNKEEPTDEELELVQRYDLLAAAHQEMQETMHRMAEEGLAEGDSPNVVLERIRTLMAPAHARNTATELPLLQ